MAYDKVVDSTMLDAEMTATANAIRKKSGSNSSVAWESGTGFAAAIESITAGGIEEKNVNFYDYDGTLLYSYTIAEARSLTELPTAPKANKDFLIFNTWTWTLDQIKEKIGTTDVDAIYTTIDVGAIYTTIDNAVYIELEFDNPGETITLNVRDLPTVHWGDGSSSSAVALGSTHTYSQAGKYTLKIVGGGSLGNGTNTTQLISGEIRKTAVTAVYCNVGRSCNNYCFNGFTSMEVATVSKQEGMYLFQNCRRLKHINKTSIIPASCFNGCSSLRLACVSPGTGNFSIQSQAFRGCNSLKRLPLKEVDLNYEGYHFYGCYALDEINVWRNGALGTMCFYACYSAKSITVGEKTTGIGSQCFYACDAAGVIDLPSTLTSIAAQAFSEIYAVKKIIFRSSTPPTVANANAFSTIPTDCIVEVPAASLNAYQTATNYGKIAEQMVGV